MQHSEQGDDVAADVVDDLDLRPDAPAQKDAAHADEGLDIGVVRGDGQHMTDALGQMALAAQPRRRRLGRGDGALIDNENISRTIHLQEDLLHA